jgi:Uma2 family endonuclease
MKAVVPDVSQAELARRKLTGIDRWDEMWEGVLHLAPAPYDEHQRILGELVAFLLPLLKRSRRGTLRAGINVFREASFKEDYRIPDLTFVAAGREAILAKDGVRGGGPDAVLEIRSPGDETYDKFPFFAALGVREVVVVDRDTKRTEVYRLVDRQYVPAAPDADGAVLSEVLGVRFRLEPGETPLLVVRDAPDPSQRAEI